MKYWLMKSEPLTYSINDLEKEGTTMWEGVRNYQARNYMKKDMNIGDKVLFYHSNSKPPGIIGLATITSKPYPDPTQHDTKSKYFDKKSDKNNPRWWLVNITYKKTFKEIISLEKLKSDSNLKEMKVTQKGQRLSIQPVTKKEYEYILKIAEK